MFNRPQRLLFSILLPLFGSLFLFGKTAEGRSLVPTTIQNGIFGIFALTGQESERNLCSY